MRFSIRGHEGIVREGEWTFPIPAPGTYISAEGFGLVGTLLFIGSDEKKGANSNVTIVRFLHMSAK